MALGLGEGGEVQAPMARVVIGGLLTSTLITLVLIPILYATIEEYSLREPKSAAAEEEHGAEPSLA
jgi:HAE1 family hydrophobic/amphiphilic exporter-1